MAASPTAVVAHSSVWYRFPTPVSSPARRSSSSLPSNDKSRSATKSSLLCLHVPPPRNPYVTSARPKGNHSSSTAKSSPSPSLRNNKGENEEDDNLDEDAFDALFAQLEDDLQNDDLSLDSDDEVNDEDLAMFEKELADALSDEDCDEFPNSSFPDSMDTDYKESEERHPKLKNWQLRRLAVALKMGRRKAKIKRLAAELELDRAFVLELLRDPPSTLLILSSTLPATIEQHTETIKDEVVKSPPTPVSGPAKIDSQLKAPSHIMQSRWSARKRLKKVQVEVFERVYYRTKRPTNAMIYSIAELTNLPWKRVVKWFEDKRDNDGIPQKRVPFRR